MSNSNFISCEKEFYQNNRNNAIRKELFVNANDKDLTKTLVKEYYPNGSVKTETYYTNNVIDRIDGPAVIKRNICGDIRVKRYYSNGKIHREDKPAVTYYGFDGYLEQKGYYRDGKLHRENGPAVIEYYENGKIRSERYYINGKYNRDDKPGVINYYENRGIAEKVYYYSEDLKTRRIIRYNENGNKSTEQYCVGEEFSNNNKPAKIKYYESGNIKEEIYCINNKYHREDGPAVIRYKEDGVTQKECRHYIDDYFILVNTDYIEKDRIIKCDNKLKLYSYRFGLLYGHQSNKEELIELIDSILLIFNIIQ